MADDKTTPSTTGSGTKAPNRRARKMPPTKDQIAEASKQLATVEGTAEWWSAEDKKLSIDTLFAKLTGMISVVQDLADALGANDIDNQGHEVKPAVDYLGKTRATAGAAMTSFKKEMADYVSGKLDESDMQKVAKGITKLRSTARKMSEDTANMLKAIAKAQQALELQREQFAQLNGAEIDEEIRREQERIQHVQERIKTLEAKKNARGRKKAAS
jgi:hypothetical protein